MKRAKAKPPKAQIPRKTAGCLRPKSATTATRSSMLLSRSASDAPWTVDTASRTYGAACGRTRSTPSATLSRACATSSTCSATAAFCWSTTPRAASCALAARAEATDCASSFTCEVCGAPGRDASVVISGPLCSNCGFAALQLAKRGLAALRSERMDRPIAQGMGSLENTQPRDAQDDTSGLPCRSKELLEQCG
jgi:hypothetical protein